MEVAYCGGTMKESPILELWNCAAARKLAEQASVALRREHEEEQAAAINACSSSCPSDEDVISVQNLLGR